MPKLPRADNTVAFAPRPQPESSGGGYSAVGNAMQGLGRSVSEAGAAFDAALGKEDEFQDQLALLKWTNQQEQTALKNRLEYNRDDPTGYATEQYGAYKQSADQFIPTLKTQKGRQSAALTMERHGGNLYERDLQFEYAKRSEKIGGELESAISGEFAKPWSSDDLSSSPEEMYGRLKGIEAIIKAAPIGDKRKYSELAAKLAIDKMREGYAAAGKLEEFYPAVKRFQDWLGISAGEAGGVAAPGQSGAGQAMKPGRMFPVPSTTPDQVPRSGGAPNSREHMGPRAGGSHAGWDIPGKVGDPVVAIDQGTVIAKGSGQGYGDYIDVQYADGTIHRLAHLGDQSKGGKTGAFAKGIEVGATVKAGQELGYLGYSGNAGKEFPHVHYEIFPDEGAYKKAAGGSSRATANLRVNPREYFEGKPAAQDVQAGGADYRGKSGPAAIRYNNPGAMYPGPSASKFGAVGTETIGGGHKIAVFPDAVSGAAAQFDLLASDKYVGLKVKDAIAKWSGGNSVGTYLGVLKDQAGVDGNATLTAEMVRDPKIAVPLAKAMARQESGKDYPLSDEQWQQAHRMALGGGEAPPLAQRGITAGHPNQKPVLVADSSGRLPAVLGAPASSPGVMTNTLENILKQNDTWAREHAALQEVWAHKQAAKIKAMVDLADKGFDPPDDEIAMLKDAISKKPELDAKYQLSAGLAGVESAVQLGRKMRMLTPTQLAAGIEEVDGVIRDAAASNKINTEQMAALVKRKDMMSKMLANMQTEINKDPMSWVEKAKIDVPVPGTEARVPIVLERMDPKAPQLAEMLSARIEQASRVAAYYQQPIKVFTATEREAFKDWISSQKPDVALFTLGQIAKSAGPHAVAAVNEVAPKEPELARAGYLVATGGDRQAAMDIFATHQRRKDPNYKAVAKFGNNEERQHFQAVVGDMFDRLPSNLSAGQEADSVIRAAESIYEARNKTGNPDPEKFKAAVKLALGEHVIDKQVFGGSAAIGTPGTWMGSYKVPVPSWMRQDTFDQVVGQVTMKDLQDVGIPRPRMDGQPALDQKRMSDMMASRQLIPIGPGQYFMAKGDRTGAIGSPPELLADVNGNPFVLDLDKLKPILKKNYPVFVSEPKSQ